VVVEAVTVGRRVVAAPLFSDVGLLYYRTDLFEKHGIDAPPATWDELEAIARRIQEAERAEGNADFYGYGFAGKAGESLTCEALEWLASHGATSGFLEDGAPVFSSEASLAALQRATAWPGTIAPPNSFDLDIREIHAMFERGELAMMRNWTWSRVPLELPESPVAGRVMIARMPGGPGGQFATLGGWNVAVSRYSKHPDEAIAFARWFTSAPVLARRFEDGGFPPPRSDAWPLVRPGPHLEVLEVSIRHAVLRPSRIARERYNEVSSVIFTQLNAMLRGEQEPDAAARNIDNQLRDLLRR
jgi:trehalose/maltose transport system substrate-binding protein